MIFLRSSNVVQSECGYIPCPSLPFLVPQTSFMLSQLVCLSTFSTDVSINGTKTSVSVISTKGILPARHVGLWEPCGRLKGKLWLHSLANESQLGHRYVWGVGSWESRNQSGGSAPRKSWKSPYNSHSCLGQLPTTSRNWALPQIRC